jgi:hypothetical protein
MAVEGGRRRLETAATIVGLISGVIALVRELVNLLQSAFG